MDNERERFIQWYNDTQLKKRHLTGSKPGREVAREAWNAAIDAARSQPVCPDCHAEMVKRQTNYAAIVWTCKCKPT